MKYDLRRPCKNCPFRSDETRITFASRERAAEIEESAYRNGFPCHLSAELQMIGPDEEGYVAGDDTQYCAGHAIFEIQAGGFGSPWPGIDNDEELYDRLAARVDLSAPVFRSVEDFLDANTEGQK